jgi:hypothetical protein
MCVGPDFVGQLLEEVTESRAPVAERRSSRALFAPVMQLMSSFMDLIEAGKSPGTKTLDELSDFPPSSMDRIQFELLDQKGPGQNLRFASNQALTTCVQCDRAFIIRPSDRSAEDSCPTSQHQ